MVPDLLDRHPAPGHVLPSRDRRGHDARPRPAHARTQRHLRHARLCRWSGHLLTYALTDQLDLLLSRLLTRFVDASIQDIAVGFDSITALDVAFKDERAHLAAHERAAGLLGRRDQQEGRDLQGRG